MERCRRNQPDCRWQAMRLGPHIVKHHIFFPESLYVTAEEKEFRELPSNKVEMCKCREEQLHALYPEGMPKPSPEVMRFCLEAERLKRQLGSGDE